MRETVRDMERRHRLDRLAPLLLGLLMVALVAGGLLYAGHAMQHLLNDLNTTLNQAGQMICPGSN